MQMDVYEAIEKRRTVRAFEHRLSEEQLRKILLAGTKAPSGSNVQPWEFVLVEDPKVIQRLAELKYEQTLRMPLPEDKALQQRNAYQNCTVLAVCQKKGHGNERKPWMSTENIGSCWMCIQNMALAATSDGLGVMPSIFREEYKTAVEEILGIPEDYELTSILLMGVQQGLPREKEFGAVRPEFSWLHKGRFGIR
jgi:nitroreductase